MKPDEERDLKTVWEWFTLSYAAYLTMPRALMCEMPPQWQDRMVALLEEFEERYRWPLHGERIEVRLRGPDGRMVTDPLSDYRHPHRDDLKAHEAKP